MSRETLLENGDIHFVAKLHVMDNSKMESS
jgi:hypothetical protein